MNISIVAIVAVAVLPMAGVAANPIQGEIDAVAAKGGGRVIVSAGEHFSDGPIRLRSNVELHLEEGAKLVFSDDPAKYLPAVPTSWELSRRLPPRESLSSP